MEQKKQDHAAIKQKFSNPLIQKIMAYSEEDHINALKNCSEFSQFRLKLRKLSSDAPLRRANLSDGEFLGMCQQFSQVVASFEKYLFDFLQDPNGIFIFPSKSTHFLDEGENDDKHILLTKYLINRSREQFKLVNILSKEWPILFFTPTIEKYINQLILKIGKNLIRLERDIFSRCVGIWLQISIKIKEVLITELFFNFCEGRITHMKSKNNKEIVMENEEFYHWLSFIKTLSKSDPLFYQLSELYRKIAFLSITVIGSIQRLPNPKIYLGCSLADIAFMKWTDFFPSRFISMFSIEEILTYLLASGLYVTFNFSKERLRHEDLNRIIQEVPLMNDYFDSYGDRIKYLPQSLNQDIKQLSYELKNKPEILVMDDIKILEGISKNLSSRTQDKAQTNNIIRAFHEKKNNWSEKQEIMSSIFSVPDLYTTANKSDNATLLHNIPIFQQILSCLDSFLKDSPLTSSIKSIRQLNNIPFANLLVKKMTIITIPCHQDGNDFCYNIKPNIQNTNCQHQLLS